MAAVAAVLIVKPSLPSPPTIPDSIREFWHLKEGDMLWLNSFPTPDEIAWLYNDGKGRSYDFNLAWHDTLDTPIYIYEDGIAR